MYLVDLTSRTTIVDCSITGNLAGMAGGGIYFFGRGAPTILRSTISGNTSRGNGDVEAGGGIVCLLSSPLIQECEIVGNRSVGDGGGIYVAKLRKGGAAEKAGLEKGDVITVIDGYEIDRIAYA